MKCYEISHVVTILQHMLPLSALCRHHLTKDNYFIRQEVFYL